jgi:hypothetical protein
MFFMLVKIHSLDYILYISGMGALSHNQGVGDKIEPE